MELGFTIFIIVITIIMIICAIGIVYATQVQNQQQQKYLNCIKAINEREDESYNYDGSLTSKQIKKKDKTVNPEELQKKLYEKFLSLQEKINNLDDKLDTLLTGFIKIVYADRINLYKDNNTCEKLENINLIGYSIIEFDKDKLKFRLKINALNYKMKGNEVISGSNKERVELIYVITYEKHGKVWKISNIEKVMEKKMEL